MTDHTTRRSTTDSGEERADSAELPGLPDDTDGVASTDAYEVDDAVVLFDIENPLAWVEADDAVSLSRMA